MRYATGHRDASRRRIMAVAARQFRQNGIAASGLAGIMSEAGLTNGAFYAHFASKDELVEKSLAGANDEQWTQFEQALAEGRLNALIGDYLSEKHRDHPDSGCPSAALLPEISRQDSATRHAYTAGLKRLLGAVAQQLKDVPRGPKAQELAIGTLGLLIGTLQMARAVDDPSLSAGILAAGARVAKRLARDGT